MATKYITLTKGKKALVDADMFDYLNQWKWYYKEPGYAERTQHVKNGKKKHIKMHRLIMDTQEDMDVDHIDNDGINNTKENLRNCTRQQNLMNKSKQSNGKSIFKGVYWEKGLNKWRSRIKANNKHIHLGVFLKEKEAAKAYNEAAKKHFGEFAYINNI